MLHTDKKKINKLTSDRKKTSRLKDEVSQARSRSRLLVCKMYLLYSKQFTGVYRSLAQDFDILSMKQVKIWSFHLFYRYNTNPLCIFIQLNLLK